MEVASTHYSYDEAAADDGSWYQAAACQGMGPELFFPTKGHTVPAEVKQACADCPVRDECLAYAVKTHQAFGVWGGLTPEGRARYLRRLRARRYR